MKPTLIPLLLFGFVLLCDSALACVGCREPGATSISNTENTVQAGIALSWSVLFLLVVVGGVLTFLGAMLTKGIREADRRSQFPES